MVAQKKLTQLVPPKLSPPNKDFVVVRDVLTTWNASIRALDGKKGRAIKTKNKKRGIIVLEPVSVILDEWCDCGMLGERPLRGMGVRNTTIRMQARAPKETLVVISCHYSRKHTWKDAEGRIVREEQLPCISNGKYELELYGRVIGYMGP